MSSPLTGKGRVVSLWICETCGNCDYQPEQPPSVCPICEDDRQWVPATGQRWTTLDALKADGCVSVVREVEPGLTGIGATRQLGIGQRGLLLRTDEGNVLWDPSGFLDEAAIAAVRELGGLRAVSSSHPHFYGAIVEWARAFDAEILLPAVDLVWLSRPESMESHIRTWSDTETVLPGVTLVQCGGHFPGSAVLHWAGGADGAGVVLSGDTINISPGEDRVAFLYSAPNRLPLPERGVRGVVDAVWSYEFDRIYGHWWEPAIRRDAKRVLKESTDHYLRFLTGEAPDWIASQNAAE
jgi:hypothetical protein